MQRYMTCETKLERDNDGSLTTNLDDKRNDSNFSIVNSPYLCSSILSSPAYGFLSISTFDKQGYALRRNSF